MKIHKYTFFYISILFLIIIFLLLFYINYLAFSNHETLYKSFNTSSNYINTPEIIQELPVYPIIDPKYNDLYFKFQQIGSLTSLDTEKFLILPLFGRKINSNRWLYYSASEKNNQLRIDIQYENKICKDKIVGCNEIYDGDIITIPSYDSKEFKVSLYEMDLKYN
jgi:hypothetical protein